MALAWTPSARLKQVALERAQPLAASLELTYRCNWRCVFCYNPRHHDRRGLSGAEWLAVLDDLRDARHALRRPHRRRAAHPPGVPRHRPRRPRARLRAAHPDERRARHRRARRRDRRPPAARRGAEPPRGDRRDPRPRDRDARLLRRHAARARPPPRPESAGRPQDAAHSPQRGRDGRHAADRGRARRDLADRPRAHAARRRGRRAARLPGLARRRCRGCSGTSRPSASSRTRSGRRAARTAAWGGPRSPSTPRATSSPACSGAARRSATCARRRCARCGRAPRSGWPRPPWPAPPTTAWSRPAALASFPFCPALALQRTGDPLRPDESHLEQAEIAERIRLDPR